MEISIEKIIEIVTREVVKELVSRGFKINQSLETERIQTVRKNSMEVDMNGFKSPILTENHLKAVDTCISELIVPVKTVITPGARDIIRKKKLTIIYKS